MAVTTPLVTHKDVAARLGIADFDDDLARNQAKVYCQDVSDLIRTLRPQIDAWIAAGKVRPGVVVAVAAEAVQRALFTADTGGIPKVGESHPELSVQFNQASKGGLFIADDRLALITWTDTAVNRGKAFSIIPS